MSLKSENCELDSSRMTWVDVKFCFILNRRWYTTHLNIKLLLMCDIVNEELCDFLIEVDIHLLRAVI